MSSAPPATAPPTTVPAVEGADGFRLTAAGDGRYSAGGPLTFATARSAGELGERLLTGTHGAALEIDCAGISPADSAGLAVLIDWLGAAKRAGRRLRYSNLPHGLTALASISEVEGLLTRGI